MAFSDKMACMAERAAILEDDLNRVVAMRACLEAILPGVEIDFFSNAQEMIAWFGEHLGEVALISLDHDLPLRDDAGRSVDSGTGRQVADFLASLPPTCPVIVHSSNNFYAPGVFFTLKDAGWPCSRVYPCDDYAWIADAWADEIRRYVRDGWTH